MESKKYFIGVLLLISYLGLVNIFENLARLIVNGFEKSNALLWQAIILVFCYLVIMGLAIYIFKKKKMEINKLFLLFFLITIFIKIIQFSSNYFLSTITSGVSFDNSSDFFNNEVMIKGIFNPLFFIGLSLYFFLQKNNT